MFIKDYSCIAKPLFTAITKAINQSILLGKEERAAFKELKKALALPPILAYFDFEKQTRVKTNSLNLSTRGVLT